jgi:hypothetical protein
MFTIKIKTFQNFPPKKSRDAIGQIVGHFDISNRQFLENSTFPKLI